MSARGLFLRSKLLLNPGRHCFPSIYARGRIVNGEGAFLIPRQWKQNVTTESHPTSTDISSSQGSDVDNLPNGATLPKAHDIEKIGNALNSERQRTHQFDTYRFVLALQSVGYSRPQAVALMKCLRTVLVNGTEFAKSHYLSRGDLENVNLYRWTNVNWFQETYLFRAAMSELRTEVKTVRHSEAIAEGADIISLQKELEALKQRTREDLENLRNDVTIEMNNRKIATRAEQQTMEIKIQDLNYGFTKRLADMRTEAEAQKWQTTRLLICSTRIVICSNGIVTLVTMVMCGLGVTRYIRNKNTEVNLASEGVQTNFSPENSSRRDPPADSDLVTLG